MITQNGAINPSAKFAGYLIFVSMIKEKKPYQILLVEDNPGDVALTHLAFQQQNGGKNFQISVISDGEEALAYLKRKNPYEYAVRPDLILLDLHLPKIDGSEVLKEVKEDPKTRQIPVIVLTTSNHEQDVNMAYSLHANCFVRKPLEFDAFIQLIQLIDEFWLTTVQLPSSPE